MRFQWKCLCVFSHAQQRRSSDCRKQAKSRGHTTRKAFFHLMEHGVVKIIGNWMRQSCAVFSVALTVFVHIRLMFLKAAFVPESLHTHTKFFIFIVQVQCQDCDSYTVSACKAVKINQNFLHRIFHWHHWRICLKTDGIIWATESRLWTKRNIWIN